MGICLVTVVIFVFCYVELFNAGAGIDQVLFSVLLSIWTVITMLLIFMEPIMKHIKLLHLGKTESPNLPIKKLSLIAIGISLLALIIGIVVHYLCLTFVENDPVWEVNIRNNCPKFFTKSNDTMDRFYSG